jgi:hypothetical protein
MGPGAGCLRLVALDNCGACWIQLRRAEWWRAQVAKGSSPKIWNAGIKHHRTACTDGRDGPSYTDVGPGNIVYYNPMDSITIIYTPNVLGADSHQMGRITSDLAAFEDLQKNIALRIERV